MSGSEIMNSLKMARKFALECNYDSAATFYDGIDKEIATHIAALKRRGGGGGATIDTTKWELLRVKVADEKNGIQQLQAELQAVQNPVAAVRLDRHGYSSPSQNNNNNNNNARNDLPIKFHQQQQYNNRDDAPIAKKERHWRPGMYGKPMAGDEENNNTSSSYDDDDDSEDDRQPYNKKQQNQRGPRRSSSDHQKKVYPYGDPLKFGPGKDQPTPPAKRSSSNNAGANQQQRRRYGGGGGDNPNPGYANVGQMGLFGGGVSPPPNGNGNNNNNNKNGKDQLQRKPPLPKFGGGNNNNNNNARAPAGGGQQQQRGNNNNNNRNNNNNNNQAGKDRPLRFVPRPGDEEYASMIEGDILHAGSTSTRFDDIAGQEEAKALLEEAVVYPSLMPDYYQGIRRPWKGILLYGPPGTGKSLLARAVAGEGSTTFFNISHATLTSKFRGDSEKLIRVLFDMARHYSPSTIFIDEIDALCSQRGVEGEHEASKRAKSMLLTAMDGVGVDTSKVVMVLGATNHPWSIDEAMRRRLEQRIYIPLPAYQDRIDIFRLNTNNIVLGDDVSFEQLSAKLEGRNYSGADITTLCRDAAMYTMRRFMEDDQRKQEMKRNPQEVSKQLATEPVVMEDFYKAMRKVPSSVNMDQVRKYEEWKKEYQVQI